MPSSSASSAGSCPNSRFVADYLAHRLTTEEIIVFRIHASGCRVCQEAIRAQKQADAGATPPARGLLENGNRIDIDFDEEAAPLDPPERPDELGRLPNIRLLRQLGRGGMGVVFLGEDLRDGCAVAVKLLVAGRRDRDSQRIRFQREAEATAAVCHPNIVPLRETGESRGCPYIVMPYLPGESLDDCLENKRRIGLAMIVWIGRETACGLHAAHEQGIIHRDIKPSNIFLVGVPGETPSEVRILDFGLARFTGSVSKLTRSGMVVGTPGYIAPEQALGGKVDGRADLFGLGCVLYRLCTGQDAFPGANVLSVLNAISKEKRIPVQALNPNVPRPLAELIEQMIAKAPEKRPRSAEEVARRLSDIHAKLVRRSTSTSRSPRIKYLLAAGLLAAAAVGFLIWKLTDHSYPHR